MKPRKPPRHCVICGDTYHKTGSAKTCGSLECRAEAVRQRHHRWRPSNRAKLHERSSAWYRANPERQAAYTRKWRAKKKAESDKRERKISREIENDKRERKISREIETTLRQMERPRKTKPPLSARGRESHRKQQARWAKANPDCITEAQRKWREKNPEYFRQFDRDRYAADPEKKKARSRAYYAANKVRINATRRARRAVVQLRQESLAAPTRRT